MIQEEEKVTEEYNHRIPADFIPDLEKRPLSYSSLKKFAISPLHFLQYLTAPYAGSDAMILGDLVDVLLLTPDEYEKRFVIIPDNAPEKVQDRSLNAKYMQEGSKEFDQQKYNDVMKRVNWWKKFEDSMVEKKDELGVIIQKRKIIISKEILEKARRMVEAVQNYPPAAELIATTEECQMTINFRDPKTDLKLVAKLDGRVNKMKFWDLKSTRSIEPDKYARQAFDLRYDLQAAVYSRGMQVLFKTPAFQIEFYQIIVESCEPFAVDVRKADQDFIRVGAGELDRLLQEIIYCRDNDLWRTMFDFKRFGNKIGTLSLPAYARNLIEQHK